MPVRSTRRKKKRSLVPSVRSKNKPDGDKVLLILIAVLVFFGVIMIYDATVVFAQAEFGGAYRFVLQHVFWLFLGSAGFLFFYNYNYNNLPKLSYTFFLVTLVVLGLLAFAGLLTSIGVLACGKGIGFVPCVNGARRWLYLNPPPLPKVPFFGILSFQPSEFAKLSLVMYLSVQISKNLKKKDNVFMVFATTTAVVSGLVLLQPNMSTAVLLLIIASVIYFSSGAPLKPILVASPILIFLGGLAMLGSSYRRQRLMTLLGSSGGRDLTLGYHMQQILISLGSGGFFGLGFGQSRQKYQYLPEVSADSIFAVIGEELGFLGTFLLVSLFLFFIYKGLSIAKSAPNLLGRLLAVGVTSWIGLQFFINVAAMTKLIPLTGIPIPLISYGGTATVFALMGLGILANVSRYSKD